MKFNTPSITGIVQAATGVVGALAAAGVITLTPELQTIMLAILGAFGGAAGIHAGTKS